MAGGAEAQLIAYALSLPEAVLEHPWGHALAKVRGKTFAFFGGDAGMPGELALSVKLPMSGEMALSLPQCEPARYGLGKSGWVQYRAPAGHGHDLPMLEGWIRQSYRAIAPKKLGRDLAEP